MSCKAVSDGKTVLNYAMVGGGAGSFIGAVHRRALDFDGNARLVAGCFSRDFENTLATGKSLDIDPGRLYRTFEMMAAREREREDKIDFVAIVIPNSLHYPAAKTFLEQDINVVCDKPFTLSVAEAEELAQIAKERGLLIGVTYTYSGYPMVKQAREMVRRGDIGAIRVIMGEYAQGSLAAAVEQASNKHAIWHDNPQIAGQSNCLGDIGVHIENTVAYITDLRIKALCANLDIFGAGRQLDDNAEIMVKYTNGASGVYWCSKVAVGHENGLRIRIFGTKGTLEWEQENPNFLKVAFLGKPMQIYSRGSAYLYPPAVKAGRIPAGHPEGYYEAFANFYAAFTAALIKKRSGLALSDAERDFPSVYAGIDGVKFIDCAVASSRQGAVWVDF
jgi:predicted dehydrogenase